MFSSVLCVAFANLIVPLVQSKKNSIEMNNRVLQIFDDVALRLNDSLH